MASASDKDIFFDLGCGVGQLCILAAAEFHVEKAVGIESHAGRAKKAQQRVASLGLEERIQIIHGDVWDIDLSEATIAYYGLTEWDEDLEDLGKKLSPDCKLVTLFLPLVGVLPDKVDYPFYRMTLPFVRTRSLSSWIEAVLSKPASNAELFEELDSDELYYYEKRSFKRMLRDRLDLP